MASSQLVIPDLREAQTDRAQQSIQGASRVMRSEPVVSAWMRAAAKQRT
jgi:hypothetical protein